MFESAIVVGGLVAIIVLAKVAKILLSDPPAPVVVQVPQAPAPPVAPAVPAPAAPAAQVAGAANPAAPAANAPVAQAAQAAAAPAGQAQPAANQAQGHPVPAPAAPAAQAGHPPAQAPAARPVGFGEKAWKFIWTDTWTNPSKARLLTLGLPALCVVFAWSFPDDYKAMSSELKQKIAVALFCLPFSSVFWNWKGEGAGKH